MDSFMEKVNLSKQSNKYIYYSEIFEHLLRKGYSSLFVTILSGTYLDKTLLTNLGYLDEDRDFIKNDLFTALKKFILVTAESDDEMVKSLSDRMVNNIKEHARQAACEIFRNTKHINVDREEYTCIRLGITYMEENNLDKHIEIYADKVANMFATSEADPVINDDIFVF